MNGLVEKMLDLTADRETEIAFLEGLFNEDCKCESSHQAEVPTCSGEVVARKRTPCSGRDFTICSNSYRWNMSCLESGVAICMNCKSPVEECWTINLI